MAYIITIDFTYVKRSYRPNKYFISLHLPNSQ